MYFKVLILCSVELVVTLAFCQRLPDFDAPACKTLDNQVGRCIPLHHCVSARERLKRKIDIDYVIRSQCNVDPASHYPNVCCAINVTRRRLTRPPTMRSTVTQPPAPPTFDPNFHESDDLMQHRNAGKKNGQNCGHFNSDEIAIGNITNIFEYPFMALIIYRNEVDELTFDCGGTLINENYILTAAHCVIGLGTKINLASVRLGEHNILTSKDCRKSKDKFGQLQELCAPDVQDIYISSITIHPDYRDSSYGSPDIALIRLKEPADLTRKNIAPICLPLGVHTTDKKGIVTGWGQTETHLSRSDILHKAVLDFVSNTECSYTYYDITDGQLCARGINHGPDACAGDSGGPLLITEPVGNSIGSWVQLGIVSRGRAFCSGATQRPILFTSVTSQLKWILDNID